MIQTNYLQNHIKETPHYIVIYLRICLAIQ